MTDIGTPYVGRSLLRREDRRLLTGQGQFIADLVLPRMLHAVLVRSPVAHARIRAVDLSRTSDQLRTGDWHDFRGLCNSKLRVASGYNLCSLGTRNQYRFPLHLLGDAETIKDAGEINAACASPCDARNDPNSIMTAPVQIIFFAVLTKLSG